MSKIFYIFANFYFNGAGEKARLKKQQKKIELQYLAELFIEFTQLLKNLKVDILLSPSLPFQ